MHRVLSGKSLLPVPASVSLLVKGGGSILVYATGSCEKVNVHVLHQLKGANLGIVGSCH